MSNQHDPPQPEEPTPPGGSAPISGEPWSTPSGDPLSPEPYRPPAAYAPGYAPIPEPPTSQFPPVQGPINYAPPGYAPDYGPAYPPPPGHPGYGPPPPRKSNAPLVAVILAVSLLLCGGLVTAGVLIAHGISDKAKEVLPTAAPTVPELPGLPTDVPTDVPGGRKISVTYEVSGDGPVSIIYLEKAGETPVRLSNVKLPWKFSTEMETPALLSVTALRVGIDEGQVGCTASIDGDEVKSNTSGESNFATVTCTHLALD